MMKTWTVLAVLVAGSWATAGEIEGEFDQASGLKVYTLSEGPLEAKVVPDAGFNVISLKFHGRQILRQPPSVAEATGFMYGVPLLYPTPNRVRGSKLKVGDFEATFTPNDGENFLHGLVHSAPFTGVDSQGEEGSPSLKGRLVFTKGTPWFDSFPIEHSLAVSVTVFADRIRWTYTVDCRDAKRPIPYGFAIHPWFLDQEERSTVRLTVAADHLMESVDLLPTGKLLPVEGTKFDLRKGRTLNEYDVDDVWYGLSPQKSARIDFEKTGLTITLKASEQFTHLVVYTGQEGHFCVENQTCSTDAHNLHEKGVVEAAHLLVCEPGEKQSGYVTMKFAQK